MPCSQDSGLRRILREVSTSRRPGRPALAPS
jgi:hypothetical protein